MTTPNDRSSARPAQDNSSIVDAARKVVATKGLSGMSLRTVAEEAGTSVGSISYRIGDRAALITAILGREIELMAATRVQWRERLGGLDPVATGILADLICEWLDEGAGARRVSATVTCELALLASRDPAAFPGMAALLGEGEALWRDLLCASPKAGPLALFIADYCLDEQPFSILLAGETDYRLLRHSTVRGMLRESGQGQACPGDASAWHMALVDRLAVPAGPAHDATAKVPEGNKAVLADHIADLISSQGVGALSHRAVAQASGTATSSVAHHFPAHRDILFAGVETLYRRMRSEIRSSNAATPAHSEIVRLTHECALTALTDPAVLPFAIDMRRRRAENVHVQFAEWLGIPAGSDRARVQAAVMASIGARLRAMATQSPPQTGPDLVRSFQE
ncbi:TetR/AcrR family transcriptional regulator [Novosphingobium sp. P6W]|uniref:TetR/AcrR family transcriptional regulator n=1 Tax=Novosphingobium sp. P6W TaxID=1609758 RepID=UPI0005C30245|nr:TetR/AcrR family transcriptional regulator [Novosphingobium sp. P6W]AXB76252.1 TetR/AcrR family transcriptional regulator [Novosphingobium sp. P6W]KIS29877.1 TetR family transcriptional regulator [Novosphingobium sp. P6W]